MSQANISYYDGNNDLVKVSLRTSTYPSGCGGMTDAYQITGMEFPGTWHIVRYEATDTPPAKFNASVPLNAQFFFQVE
jgi:hypothetical protein